MQVLTTAPPAQAKLNAVSTLYTEAAQREAVLRLQLEQSGGGATPSYE